MTKAIEAAEVAAQQAIRKAAYEIAEREGEADGRWFSQALAIVATEAAITAYLAAMKAEGFVMVPVEPTGAMERAGGEALEGVAWAQNSYRADALEAYRAMIAAATPHDDGGE